MIKIEGERMKILNKYCDYVNDEFWTKTDPVKLINENSLDKLGILYTTFDDFDNETHDLQIILNLYTFEVTIEVDWQIRFVDDYENNIDLLIELIDGGWDAWYTNATERL